MVLAREFHELAGHPAGGSEALGHLRGVVAHAGSRQSLGSLRAHGEPRPLLQTAYCHQEPSGAGRAEAEGLLARQNRAILPPDRRAAGDMGFEETGPVEAGMEREQPAIGMADQRAPGPVERGEALDEGKDFARNHVEEPVGAIRHGQQVALAALRIEGLTAGIADADDHGGAHPGRFWPQRLQVCGGQGRREQSVAVDKYHRRKAGRRGGAGRYRDQQPIARSVPALEVTLPGLRQHDRLKLRI